MVCMCLHMWDRGKGAYTCPVSHWHPGKEKVTVSFYVLATEYSPWFMLEGCSACCHETQSTAPRLTLLCHGVALYNPPAPHSTHKHTHTHTHIHMHAHTHTHARTLVLRRACMCMYTHRPHAHTYSRTLTRVLSCTHTHTPHTHACTHTETTTHTRRTSPYTSQKGPAGSLFTIQRIPL